MESQPATRDTTAKAVGYSQPAIVEFIDLLKNVRNGTRAVSGESAEKEPLIRKIHFAVAGHCHYATAIHGHTGGV